MNENKKNEAMPWFGFWKDHLLLNRYVTPDGAVKYVLPTEEECVPATTEERKKHRVVLTDGTEVRAYALTEAETVGLELIELPKGNISRTTDKPKKVTDGPVLMQLRASYDHLPLSTYKAAGKAYQILYWDEHSRFCPVCGTPTRQETEIMKKCPQCGHELYPPVSTAIIVLIRRGNDEILLVRAKNFRGTFHGLVAGFLEAGETLEECVEREVMEETGLRIKNIRYFASQPWPYPSGLMVGFTADYAGGEIKLQADELTAGAFFHRDNLPELPRKLSIARRLIDHWLNLPQKGTES